MSNTALTPEQIKHIKTILSLSSTQLENQLEEATNNGWKDKIALLKSQLSAVKAFLNLK